MVYSYRVQEVRGDRWHTLEYVDFNPLTNREPPMSNDPHGAGNSSPLTNPNRLTPKEIAADTEASHRASVGGKYDRGPGNSMGPDERSPGALNDGESEHYKLVKAFMRKADQDVPDTPCIPDEKTRLLRAKLIFEEAMETIEALGVQIRAKGDPTPIQKVAVIESSGEPNLVEIVDGCCDVIVVTTGTLLACGVKDEAVQRLIDESNLKKFGPGGYKAGPEHPQPGRWVKPPDWKAPDIEGELRRQGWEG